MNRAFTNIKAAGVHVVAAYSDIATTVSKKLVMKAMIMQGDECAEQDALRLKEELETNKSANIEVEGEQVTIEANMVDIKQESKSGGWVTGCCAFPYFITLTMFMFVHSRMLCCSGDISSYSM